MSLRDTYVAFSELNGLARACQLNSRVSKGNRVLLNEILHPRVNAECEQNSEMLELYGQGNMLGWYEVSGVQRIW